MPSTTWKETVAADEEARFGGYAEELLALQRERAKTDGVTHRALHGKGQAGVEAEFEVLADIPEYARVGLFASPAKYRAYVRFSNGAGAVQHDKKGDVRGVAVKIVGVDGKKIIPGLEDKKTQDFLLIRSPTTPFRTADEFIHVVTAAAGSPLLVLPRVIARVGIGRAFGILGKLGKGLGEPMISLATASYFSAVGIAYGEYAVHYALMPQATSDPSAVRGSTANYLAEELGARLANGPVVYDFKVQFFVDEDKTPIEDASVEWREGDAPFVTVGRLTLSKQDMTSKRGRAIADYVEKLSFDPWHALEAHRPLGGIMRARNHAYRLSTKERNAAAEPDGTEHFD